MFDPLSPVRAWAFVPYCALVPLGLVVSRQSWVSKLTRPGCPYWVAAMPNCCDEATVLPFVLAQRLVAIRGAVNLAVHEHDDSRQIIHGHCPH